MLTLLDLSFDLDYLTQCKIVVAPVPTCPQDEILFFCFHVSSSWPCFSFGVFGNDELQFVRS